MPRRSVQIVDCPADRGWDASRSLARTGLSAVFCCMGLTTGLEPPYRPRSWGGAEKRQEEEKNKGSKSKGGYLEPEVAVQHNNTTSCSPGEKGEGREPPGLKKSSGEMATGNKRQTLTLGKISEKQAMGTSREAKNNAPLMSPPEERKHSL
ncbi:hypothetical protein NDU88_009652 [Pleurodeles waltl]|uniref:Uncharacterized protein n=1 Tax=Pleurodeles waltl TaxID=8319 RepID=A0AAV7QXX8_PLEWA|nr:hypothetical protein NDU88_009652 [Pleurodeles waltl]